MTYLPGKRIIFLIVFILLIFAGWFYYGRYKENDFEYAAKDKAEKILTVATTTESEALYEADTDGDELKDWEETLWKTDPKNKDTDGDGAEDNQEITLNRNPLKAGPDDKIGERQDIVAQNKNSSGADLNTMTAAYAKQFLSEYLTLKQQKGNLSDTDKESLVNSFIGNLKPLTAPDKYSFADLKITEDVSAVSVKKYSEEMKKIFFKDTHTLVNESLAFEMLLKNLKDGNLEFKNNITNLEYSAFKYEELVKNLISFPVPSNLLEDHIEAVNGFNNVKFAIENMAVADKDPIKAMIGKTLYDNELGRSYVAINNIQEIFGEYGIYVF